MIFARSQTIYCSGGSILVCEQTPPPPRAKAGIRKDRLKTKRARLHVVTWTYLGAGEAGLSGRHRAARPAGTVCSKDAWGAWIGRALGGADFPGLFGLGGARADYPVRVHVAAQRGGAGRLWPGVRRALLVGGARQRGDNAGLGIRLHGPPAAGDGRGAGNHKDAVRDGRRRTACRAVAARGPPPGK
ncbi:MAG: hypothetical protein MI749_21540, partial [Desulfovibrionales bacterium]|nr:hypothetical protein [Desulfovibrionales bacterium]